ncbi:flagellar hook-basal body complex protein FliE [Ramlibacter tataouinensis]|uniref:flagellar hook-basal body complex protein FliE n=1 Tax=Ramlibacter tataouinensis TaxID=94132 RepID=UPI0022F3F420|nr:flagellar hook-basal body complex protein FliE [Ramlibacter tataouinensis]WBY00619.1 flagellar hook-basal body complex protein FliE [Ramlibacter tataouinensis]
MSISPIESVLQQIRALSAAAAGDLPAAPAPGGGFAQELARSLDRISGAQQQAQAQARAFELGVPGVALNDVMVDLQKANIGFQTALQVRNRLVAAYQEVMNIPA